MGRRKPASVRSGIASRQPRDPRTCPSTTPDRLATLYHSALNYQSQGKLDRAIAAYLELLRLRPESVEALCNMGGIFHTRGQLTEAAEYYQRALQLKPDIPQLHYNLAGVRQGLGQMEAARQGYTRATLLRPDYVDALFALGTIDLESENYLVALQYFRRAIALQPTNAEILNCIGTCLRSLGDHTQATGYFQRALEANPQHFGAMANLAVDLMTRGDFNASIQASLNALSLEPDNPKIRFNLGLAYKENKQFEDAARCFRDVIQSDPAAAHARLELAHTLQTVCDWREASFSIHAAAALIRESLATDKNIDIDLFNALSLPLAPPQLQLIAEHSASKIAARAERYRAPITLPSYCDSDRLRIGYLSPKYRNHPGAHLMGGLFNAHDRDGFEIFAYSTGPDDGSIYRRRAEAEAEHFTDLRCESIGDCVERIRSDRIHILIDLAGYTTGGRPEICAARPAPIVVNFLGFPGSLGADCYDYIVTDMIVTPPDYQQYFVERFAYLPHCYQIIDDRNRAAETFPPKSAYGLPDDAFVFCCFNNNYKIDPGIFRVWSSILEAVPDSVLWLLKGSTLQMDNLRSEAARHGIESTRILFAEPVSKDIHLARHAHADLFLDTRFYNAHTTGSDALRQGVPMITCPGDTFASRVGASLLHAVGLDELVMPNLEQYSEVAIELATNRSTMNRVRGKLATGLKNSSLLDNRRYARNLERLYEVMWRQAMNGEQPRQIGPDISQ